MVVLDGAVNSIEDDAAVKEERMVKKPESEARRRSLVLRWVGNRIKTFQIGSRSGQIIQL